MLVNPQTTPYKRNELESVRIITVAIMSVKSGVRFVINIAIFACCGHSIKHVILRRAGAAPKDRHSPVTEERI